VATLQVCILRIDNTIPHPYASRWQAARRRIPVVLGLLVSCLTPPSNPVQSQHACEGTPHANRIARFDKRIGCDLRLPCPDDALQSSHLRVHGNGIANVGSDPDHEPADTYQCGTAEEFLNNAARR